MRVAGLLALLMALLVSGAHAQGRARFAVYVGDAASPIVSDGRDLAAYQPAPGRFRVLDAVGHRVRDLRPALDCEGRLAAATTGRLLVVCAQDADGLRFVDARTGAISIPGGTDQRVDAALECFKECPSFFEAGRRWLQFLSVGVEGDFSSFYNWRTGEARYVSGAAAVDLNARDLVLRSCAPKPAAVPPGPTSTTVVLRRAVARLTPSGKVRLRRCGARRTVTIATGALGLGGLSADDVLWREPSADTGTLVLAHIGRDRVTRERFGGLPDGNEQSPVLTRRAVFVTVGKRILRALR